MRQEDEKKNEQLSGAMRIFEALSSVDEELLIRSEEKSKVVPFRKYAKVMAACACLVVLCVAVFVNGEKFAVKENSSSDCAAPESNMEQAAATEDTTATAGGSAGSTTTDIRDFVDGVAADAVENAAVEMEEAAAEKEMEVGEDGSEETMRETEELGAYIPTEIPAGYVYECGYRNIEEDGTESISVLWVNGMDTIQIVVKKHQANDDLQSIYPIYGEDDFSLEVVNTCMKRVEDQGDTDTPRGRFAVLYDSGILVQFNGDGDAESIWKMFESIEP